MIKKLTHALAAATTSPTGPVPSARLTLSKVLIIELAGPAAPLVPCEAPVAEVDVVELEFTDRFGSSGVDRGQRPR
jgi:hypothetical protein